MGDVRCALCGRERRDVGVMVMSEVTGNYVCEECAACGAMPTEDRASLAVAKNDDGVTIHDLRLTVNDGDQRPRLEGPVRVSTCEGDAFLVYRKVYDGTARYLTVAESYGSTDDECEAALDDAQGRDVPSDPEWNRKWETVFDVYYTRFERVE